MMGRELSNFSVLCKVGPFLKSAHIYIHSTSVSNFNAHQVEQSQPSGFWTSNGTFEPRAKYIWCSWVSLPYIHLQKWHVGIATE